MTALENNGVDARNHNGALQIRGVGQELNSNGNAYEAAGGADAVNADNKRGTAKDTSKSNPWVFGLSRSLGGGASVILEHSNVDDDAKKNTTGLFLLVNF